MSTARPYTSQWRGLHQFLADALQNYQRHGDVRGRVLARLEEAHLIEQYVRDAYGTEIRGIDMLEIGPGQVPFQLLYFGRHNRAIGADVNVVLRRKTPLGLFRVARRNGPVRAIKTMMRGVLGIDAAYYRELSRQLGDPALPFPEVLCMDAQKLEFPDNSFDFVFSRSVFQHLPDPGKAIGEIRRVMRPGAVCYVSLHLYTSHDGYSDKTVEYSTADWPHLCGKLGAVDADQSRNRLRLSEWKDLFSQIMPDCRFVLRGSQSSDLRRRAIELQERGDLADYTVEELTTSELAALWKKGSCGSAQKR